MGGGGGKKKKKPKVQQAAPLDYGQIMAQANASAAESYRDQLNAQIEAYPQLESLQLGTVSKLADNLTNDYTLAATDAISDALANRGDLEFEAERLSETGGLIGDFALQNYLTSGPTPGELNIQRLGQSAMDVRADQVVAPGQGAIRNVTAPNARAAGMGRVADVRAQQIAAARMGNFGQAASRDIAAGQVGAGALGRALMARALERARSTGRLSAQANRDAVQSARQGMAARGLATGSAGLAAELLNRDRYSRQRMEEDLAFAGGVQAQDLGRQFQNVGNQLAAAQSNQSASMQAELANLQARYSAAVQRGNWEQAAAIQNQEAGLRASLANQQTQFGREQILSGNQQQANMANADAQMRAALANQSRDQFLAAASMDAQMANQTANINQREANRAFMLNANQAFNTSTMQRRDQAAQQAALGANLMQASAAQFGNAANLGYAGASAMTAADPYYRALQPGLQSSGSTQANLTQGVGQTYGNALNAGLGVASFNANLIQSQANSQLNNWAAMEAARMQAGAANNAATMGMVGSGVGAAIGIAGIGLAI